MPIVYVVAALLIILAVARLSNTYIPMPGSIKAVLNIALALMVIGMVLWLINTYIPMAGSIKGLLNIVVFIACCVGVLRAFGLWDAIVGLWTNFRNRQAPVRDSSEPVPQRSQGHSSRGDHRLRGLMGRSRQIQFRGAILNARPPAPKPVALG